MSDAAESRLCAMSQALTLGRFIHPRDVQQILISDAWVGLSPWAPIVSTFALKRRKGGSFAGIAQMRARLRGATLPIELSASDARAFFAEIGAATLLPGHREPRLAVDDSQPCIELALVMSTTVVSIFSRSPDELHAPWTVCANSNIYAAMGDEIGRTLSCVCQPLRRAVLGDIIGEDG